MNKRPINLPEALKNLPYPLFAKEGNSKWKVNSES